MRGLSSGSGSGSGSGSEIGDDGIIGGDAGMLVMSATAEAMPGPGPGPGSGPGPRTEAADMGSCVGGDMEQGQSRMVRWLD